MAFEDAGRPPTPDQPYFGSDPNADPNTKGLFDMVSKLGVVPMLLTQLLGVEGTVANSLRSSGLATPGSYFRSQSAADFAYTALTHQALSSNINTINQGIAGGFSYGGPSGGLLGSAGSIGVQMLENIGAYKSYAGMALRGTGLGMMNQLASASMDTSLRNRAMGVTSIADSVADMFGTTAENYGKYHYSGAFGYNPMTGITRPGRSYGGLNLSELGTLQTEAVRFADSRSLLYRPGGAAGALGAAAPEIARNASEMDDRLQQISTALGNAKRLFGKELPEVMDMINSVFGTNIIGAISNKNSSAARSIRDYMTDLRSLSMASGLTPDSILGSVSSVSRISNSLGGVLSGFGAARGGLVAAAYGQSFNPEFVNPTVFRSMMERNTAGAVSSKHFNATASAYALLRQSGMGDSDIEATLAGAGSIDEVVARVNKAAPGLGVTEGALRAMGNNNMTKVVARDRGDFLSRNTVSAQMGNVERALSNALDPLYGANSARLIGAVSDEDMMTELTRIHGSKEQAAVALGRIKENFSIITSARGYGDFDSYREARISKQRGDAMGALIKNVRGTMQGLEDLNPGGGMSVRSALGMLSAAINPENNATNAKLLALGLGLPDVNAVNHIFADKDTKEAFKSVFTGNKFNEMVSSFGKSMESLGISGYTSDALMQDLISSVYKAKTPEEKQEILKTITSVGKDGTYSPETIKKMLSMTDKGKLALTKAGFLENIKKPGERMMEQLKKSGYVDEKGNVKKEAATDNFMLFKHVLSNASLSDEAKETAAALMNAESAEAAMGILNDSTKGGTKEITEALKKAGLNTSNIGASTQDPMSAILSKLNDIISKLTGGVTINPEKQAADTGASSASKGSA